MGMITEKYVCKDCNYEREIQRNTGKKRKIGHHKDMWCLKCGKETCFIHTVGTVK